MTDMKINGLQTGNILPGGKAQTPKPDGKGFGEALKEAIQEVNALQVNADQSIKDLSTGKVKDIHETMIAMQKADVAFQTIMQVRNKIVESYQEIMRTQV